MWRSVNVYMWIIPAGILVWESYIMVSFFRIETSMPEECSQPWVTVKLLVAEYPIVNFLTTDVGSSLFHMYAPHRFKCYVWQIENQKLTWNAESKIRSLEKANYKPAGGDVKVRIITELTIKFNLSKWEMYIAN